MMEMSDGYDLQVALVVGLVIDVNNPSLLVSRRTQRKKRFAKQDFRT